MLRLYELIAYLEQKFPNDYWIERKQDTDNLFPSSLASQFDIYAQALQVLDAESWKNLSEKAEKAFRAPFCERGKSQFFDLLNEALAYQYLLQRGYTDVRFIPSSQGKRTPDLSFLLNGKTSYCEVKTIGSSEDEIERSTSEELIDATIYQTLDEFFFKKLKSIISGAIEQIRFANGYGLAYIIVHFDDWTLKHWETYREQIVVFLHKDFAYQEIYIRVGIFSNYFIWHQPR